MGRPRLLWAGAISWESQSGNGSHAFLLVLRIRTGAWRQILFFLRHCSRREHGVDHRRRNAGHSVTTNPGQRLDALMVLPAGLRLTPATALSEYERTRLREYLAKIAGDVEPRTRGRKRRDCEL